MKQVLFAGLFLTLSVSSTLAQVNSAYKFATTGSNVIAYKQGTSCTASPYSFYMIDDAGTQASVPFYTLSNTSKEVNGIGINPVDQYLYGIEYDRDVACAFSNFHLKRYDSHGNTEDLGTLPPFPGGTASGALGCLTNNGNFIYSTKDALGNNYVSVIADVASLPANASGTLTMNTSKLILNLAPGFSYADWAVHPTNNKMYTYGIASIGGISTGKVLELDPTTGILQIVGIADISSFLDAARDNFGGVYFGNDGMMYGVNVNTRKLYRIDPITGGTTLKGTMLGSGQIRADLGSYSTGWVVLPINFIKTDITTKDKTPYLNWKVESTADINEFVVEQKIGNNSFTEFKRIKSTSKSASFSIQIPTTNAQYRIAAITSDEIPNYSPVVKYTDRASYGLQVVINPIISNQLNVTTNLSGAYSYSIYTTSGGVVQTGNANLIKNEINSLSLRRLTSGMYILQLKDNEGTSVRFMVP